MSPPLFANLEKSAHDILNKGYQYGYIKVEGKLKPENGPEFSANVTNSLATGTCRSFLEIKYKSKENGLTLTERWDSGNNLLISLVLENQIKQDLELCLSGNFSPNLRTITPLLKAHFRHNLFTVNGDCKYDGSNTLINGAIVGMYKKCLLGYHGTYSATQSKLISNKFGFGFVSKDFDIQTRLDNFDEFAASVYVRSQQDIETGVQLGVYSDLIPKFALGCKYKIDNESSFQAKMNNQAQMAFSFIHKLRPGVTITLSTLLETKSLDQSGHKFGIALDLEA